MSKLTEKAKGINFDEDEDDVPTPSPAPVADKPRTAMGAISASLALGRGVEAENRALKAKLQKFEDASFVEFLDPKLVRPSRWANRHALSFSGPEFATLKAEIADAGRNVQPIKVRPLPVQPGQLQEYEIAYGHRRHRACLELGLQVAAIVEEMNDSRLFAEMDRENRERQNLSPWEQGMMYKRALEMGLFASQRQLASAIGAQSGNVSRAIQLASLPQEIIDAFASPLDLQYRSLDVINPALEHDTKSVLERARRLAAMESKLPAKEVLDRLMGHESTVAPAEAKTRLMVDGRSVGSWDRDAKGNVTLRLKAGVLGDAKERRLREFVEKLLG
jgi:ParB family chromosome partitioning protein